MSEEQKERAEAATSTQSENELTPHDSAAAPSSQGEIGVAERFAELMGAATGEVIEDDAPTDVVEMKELVQKCFEALECHPQNLPAIAAEVLKLEPEYQNQVLFAAKGKRMKGDLLAAMKAEEISQRKSATEERGLIADKSGFPVQNFENARRVLRSEDEGWKGVFRYNEFDLSVWVMRHYDGAPEGQYPRKYDDADALFLTSWFQSNGFETIYSSTVYDAAVSAAHMDRYHPVKEYLEGLQWDGAQRCHLIFQTYFECEVDQNVPGYDQYLATAGQRFMIGAVARIMQPGCKLDHMPTLSGPQGKGKSRGFAALCGEQWFGDDMPAVDNKDAKDWLRGIWFAEVAEMASMSGRDVDKVKSFLSTQKDSYRKAYGRATEEQKRQSIMCGTVNGGEYLVDHTGGRRFWPLRIGEESAIYVDRIKIDRDQLWAEAVNLYRQGCKWWFDVGECTALEVAQEGARAQDIGEELVRDWLHRQPLGTEVKAATVGGMVFPNESTGAGLSRRVGRYLLACGWEKKGTTDGSARYGRGPKAQPPFVSSDNGVVHIGPR